MIEVEQSRAEQETQAGFIVAKRFPRNEQNALERIIRSCQRKTLAEQAEYAFPRGGQQITGPSIRLAEVLAQQWGNMAFGIREIQDAEGISKLMAYCYDLESNTRSERIFNVKHERKARGKTERLTDARDIYEMVFNQGARRLRACILQVIPGDVVEAAVETCRATLEREEGDIRERQQAMTEAFSKLGVTQAMIEKRMGKNTSALLATDLVVLRRIYSSLKDGISTTEQWFEPESPADALKKKLAEAGKPEPKAAPEPPPPGEPPPVSNRDKYIAQIAFPGDRGRPSNWEKQFNSRKMRLLMAYQGQGVEDPELESTLHILGVMGTFGAETPNTIEVMQRPAFLERLDETVKEAERIALAKEGDDDATSDQ
jgi:hypothetical protein